MPRFTKQASKIPDLANKASKIPGLTKRPTVLGVPVGPPRMDWERVGKFGAMGLGAVSTAGGLGARLVGSKLKGRTSESEQGEQKDSEAADEGGETTGPSAQLGQAVRKPLSAVTSAVGTLTGSRESESGGDGGAEEPGTKKLRLIIREYVDVGVPLKVAYNQWTQFTDFPSIMRAPQKIDQVEDAQLRWTVKIGPSRRRWTAEIVEQTPDERIAWDSTDGTENRGVVTFHRLDRNLTRVQVEMEYFPHGLIEKVGNVFLAARRRVRKDLRLFKHYLEVTGQETGAWRGEIAKDGEDDSDEQQPAGAEGDRDQSSPVERVAASA